MTEVTFLCTFIEQNIMTSAFGVGVRSVSKYFKRKSIGGVWCGLTSPLGG